MKKMEVKGVKSEEKQTLTLTINKILNYLREHEQFKYSFSGARIFFKDSA